MTRRHYTPTDERLNKYRLGRDEYDALFDAQGGCCAICRTAPIQAIDHCHTTNEVRGLLCRKCNVGLGFFDNNGALMQEGAYYLYRFTQELEGDDPECATVPRQPDGWIKGSPYPRFGYTTTFGEAETGEPYMELSRNGETVACVSIVVPPMPRAKAEIFIRRKRLSELPVRDTGTYD